MTPEQVKARLETKYSDGPVEVIDLTGTHDHYEVHITSAQFDGLSRIERHKAVMALFDSELKSGEVHALTIKTQIKE